MEYSNVFTLTPMSQRIKLEPGEEYEGSITVVNPGSSVNDFSYKAEVSVYSVIDKDYTADFLTQNDHTQIAKWITIENPTGLVKPNDAIKIKYKIKVPTTAPAGGQYAAIMVSSNGDGDIGDGVAVRNVFEMASLIFAEVSGENIRAGEIINNYVPGFATTVPIEINTTLTNTGNVHEVARVSLQVKSVFSSNVIYPGKDESGTIEEVIMPDSTRFLTRNIDGISSLGMYDVTQTISYMGSVSTVQKTIIVCPIWFLLLIVLTISVLIFAIVRSIKKFRHRKEVF